jgi:class 3 adenylate cyclase
MMNILKYISKLIVKDKIQLTKPNENSFSSSIDFDLYPPTNHEDACICMIDIVNFSKWCNDKSPESIYITMTAYNTFLSEYIDKYEDVHKIELVGDSVLIVSGMHRFGARLDASTTVTNMIYLSIDILTNLNQIQEIFDNKHISLRIGIHLGNVYSGFIQNPKKFQLFGNSINIASRLESNSLPGTFTISTNTFKKLDLTKIPPQFNVLGKSKSCMLKGVGNVDIMTGFINKDAILIADDDYVFLEIFTRTCSRIYKKDCVPCDSIHKTFAFMKENTYFLCIVDVHFMDNIIYGSLKEFRDWELVYRKTRQIILLMTIDIENIKDSYLNLVDGFLDKSNVCDYSTYPSQEMIGSKNITI